MDVVKVSDQVYLGNDLPFVCIAGPCQIESLEHSLMIAEFLANLCNKHDIPFIFKASFDKANRSSATGKRGIGLDNSIKVFETIKQQIGCPVLTDIHSPEQCEVLKDVVDVMQVPAFLCRQTDLLEAVAKNAKVANIKKGQFLAPWDAKNIVDKMTHFGSKNVCLTERGVTFGYNQLVVDMRSLAIMSQQTKKPVIFDATHAVQEPGGLGNASGGNREFAPVLARAAIASSPIAGIFCEVHDNPDHAPSDGPNMLTFKMTETLLPQLKALDAIIKQK